MKTIFIILVSLLTFISCKSAPPESQKKLTTTTAKIERGPQDLHLRTAVFAGGCFWCTESDFEKIQGVKEAISGYSGGKKENPSYEEIGKGTTGHTEAIEVYYDPKEISYAELVEKFWMNCDPTDKHGQFVDRGNQYRPVIFYMNEEEKKIIESSKEKLEQSKRFSQPIVVSIEPFKKFWPAETYHQDFYKKSPTRYHQYRNGSGRDQFFEKHWK